jgi:hypothetical protein
MGIEMAIRTLFKNKLHVFYFGFSVLTLFSLLADSYKNSGTFQKYFFIDSKVLLFSLLLLSVFLRLKSDYCFPKILTFINSRIIFPISILLSVGLTLWDYFTPVNYIFAKYRINYEQVFFLALGSLALIFISQSYLWWVKNWKKSLFFSAPVIFLAFLVIRLWPFDFFMNMVLEDHFVEWNQFFVILFAGFIAFATSRVLWKKQKFFAILYILFSLGAFFIAGDEISWGQRILSFQTPKDIAMHNYQSEFTVHNLSVFGNLTWFGYLTFSAYGAFSWIFVSVMPKYFKKYLQFLSPPWFVSPFFLFSLTYHLFSNPATPTYIKEWSEPAELMMYLGVLLFFLSSYLFAKSKE